MANLPFVDPLPYLDFVQLMANARCVLTDSGRIQEETTALGVPCLTLRENTERPITVSRGTNWAIGDYELTYSWLQATVQQAHIHVAELTKREREHRHLAVPDGDDAGSGPLPTLRPLKEPVGRLRGWFRACCAGRRGSQRGQR